MVWGKWDVVVGLMDVNGVLFDGCPGVVVDEVVAVGYEG